ncbi:MAG: ATP-binding cassette domain-containing protein [Clostridia bacterium]|nr:ATP-binding cassette domain-containing protein [Clostridia bacterium]
MTLTFDKIYKSYGKTKALQGFSAELEPGIYALLGPNGSGKSTLMNILTDNLKRDSGAILFDGEEILKMGVRFREKLGFMPQYPGMYGNFTAEKFLWYMASLKDIKKEDAMEQIPKILEEVELSDVAHHKISSFSGGMKQRLALAQAVLGDPKVLVLDEPTAGLDPKQRIAIRNYISRIAFDKIVIIATHVVSDIEYIAKQVIMLKKGIVVDSGSPTELIAKMDGRVYSVPLRESEVVDFQSKYRVVNISKNEKGVVARTISDAKPTEDSLCIAPSLEDYYLFVFGEKALV